MNHQYMSFTRNSPNLVLKRLSPEYIFPFEYHSRVYDNIFEAYNYFAKRERIIQDIFMEEIIMARAEQDQIFYNLLVNISKHDIPFYFIDSDPNWGCDKNFQGLNGLGKLYTLIGKNLNEAIRYNRD